MDSESLLIQDTLPATDQKENKHSRSYLTRCLIGYLGVRTIYPKDQMVVVGTVTDNGSSELVFDSPIALLHGEHIKESFEKFREIIDKQHTFNLIKIAICVASIGLLTGTITSWMNRRKTTLRRKYKEHNKGFWHLYKRELSEDMNTFYNGISIAFEMFKEVRKKPSQVHTID